MQPTSLRLSTHTPLQLGHSPSSKPSLWQAVLFVLLAQPMMPTRHHGSLRLIPSLLTHWLKSIASIFFLACLLLGSTTSPLLAQTAFTVGNLVVVQVGNDVDPLSSASSRIKIVELTPAGSVVQTITLPYTDAMATGGNNKITAQGSSSNDANMTVSEDGRYLVLGGYNAEEGTGTPSINSNINRTFCRIGMNGSYDTKTLMETAMSLGNVRGVASKDGSGFWMVGNNTGLRYVPYGSTGAPGTTTLVSTTVTNNRTIQIFDGNLIIGSGSGSVRAGYITGLPTTMGQTLNPFPGVPEDITANNIYMTNLPGGPAGLNTMYIASDFAPLGIHKYCKNGTTGDWVLVGTLNSGSSYRGMTGKTSGSTVTLYAVTANTTIHSFVDATGYNVAPTATPTIVYTAPTNNTAFRGIAIVPPARTLTIRTAISPTNCTTPNGSIAFTSTGFAAGNQTLNYKKDAVDASASVTVAEDGSFTLSGLSAGEYTAFAIGATTATGNRTLAPPLPSVSITGINPITVGATTTLSPTSGGTWTSSNPAVATVTNAGVVTAVSNGTATFTFTETSTGCVSNPTSAVIVDGAPFVTRWDLSQGGSTNGSATTQLSFDVATSGPVNYTWKSTTTSASGVGTFSGSTATITGLPPGQTIELSIAPTNFQRIIMGNISSFVSQSQLVSVEAWGDVAWTSMADAFRGCGNLTTVTGNPILTGVTDMSYMFAFCMNFNGNITGWNTEKVTNMSYMLTFCKKFTGDITTWNTANVTDMSYMFNNAQSFNQPIGNWNTAKVQNMSLMFTGAEVFDKDISNWNTGAVTDMSFMFMGALAFNQPIGNWNTAAVTNMMGMFAGALAFNQNLGNWSLKEDVFLQGMLDYCGMDCANYSATLAGWAANAATPADRGLGANGRQYGTNAVAARTALTTVKGWTITDDEASGEACLLPCITPTAYAVTGTGAYCAGGVGVAVGLANSETGVTYQLKNVSNANVGSPINGTTGSAITFGNQIAGTYKVVATRTTGGCTADMTGSAEVTANSLPPASINRSSPSVCAGASITLSNQATANTNTAAAVAPSSGITWAASGGSFVNNTVSPASWSANTGGSYNISLTVNDGSCSNTASTTVSVHTLPTTSITVPSGAKCEGQSIALTANGTGTYAWASSAGGSFQSASGSPASWSANTAGSYTVTLTINNGTCTNSASTTISVNAKPTASINRSVTAACAGVNITLSNQAAVPTNTAAAPPSSSGISWAASDGAFANSTLSPTTWSANTGGSYNISLTVNNGSCSNTASTTVSVNPLPTVQTVTGGGEVCPGTNGVPVGLAPSQSGVTYQLKNGSNNVGSALTGTGSALNFGNQTSAGNYTVVATNSFNCSATMSGSANVTVTTPVGGTASADQTICSGTAPSNLALSGNVGNVTKWQRATNANFNGATDIAATNTTLLGSTIGNLSTDTWLRAVVQAGSCAPVNSSAVKITTIQPHTASINATTIVCTGNAISLSASPNENGLTYAWSGPGSFSSNLRTPIRSNATLAMSGAYRLTVARPACGFTSTASVSVVVSTPSGQAVPRLRALLVNGTVAGLNNVFSVCAGAPVTASIAAISGTSYSWNGPNNTSGVGSLAVTAPTPTISNAANANTAGNYTLRIFNGCDRSTTVNFSITLRNCSSTRLASADEASLGLDISLAPNPVREVLNVQVQGIEGESLQLGIHDAQGRSLQQVSIEAAEGKAQHRFDLRSLPTGLYLLQAETSSQRASKKVIKVD